MPRKPSHLPPKKSIRPYIEGAPAPKCLICDKDAKRGVRKSWCETCSKECSQRLRFDRRQCTVSEDSYREVASNTARKAAATVQRNKAADGRTPAEIAAEKEVMDLAIMTANSPVPRCLICSKDAKKVPGRKRWISTCGDKKCWKQLRLGRMRETKSSEEYHEKAVETSLKAAQTQRETIIDGKTQAEITAEKAHIARLQVGEDGLTGYQRGSRKGASKVRLTLSQIGEDGLNSYQRGAKKGTAKRNITNHTVGEDGLTGYQRGSRKGASKTKLTCQKVGEDGLTIYQRNARNAAPKIRNKHEESGYWLSLSEVEPFRKYRTLVRRVQGRYYNQIALLPNYEKRSMDGYHIDHRFSIYAGFKNDVPPEKIGHICNLEMKYCTDNLQKLAKCDLTLDELEERIAGYEARFLFSF